MPLLLKKSASGGNARQFLSASCNDICTLATSVVSLVTSDEDEYLSMFSNVYVWILWKILDRKFLAKPADAFEHVMAAIAPHASETHARTTRSAPVATMFFISAPFFTAVIISAVIKGIKTSMTTSQTIKIKVSTEGFQNSFTLLASLRIIDFSFQIKKVCVKNTQTLV